jgi:hypothetical protein
MLHAISTPAAPAAYKPKHRAQTGICVPAT